MKLYPRYLKRYKDLTHLFLKYAKPRLASKFGLDETRDELGGEVAHAGICLMTLNGSGRRSSSWGSCCRAARTSCRRPI